jgi:hypothetical protein
MGLLLALALLAVPVAHQVTGHRVLARVWRRFRPGPPVLPTLHEQRHAARPVWARIGADAGWLVYIAGAVAAGLAYSR